MKTTETGKITRRKLLAGAAGLACLGAARATRAEPAGFAFPLLGDLHFDRLAHHDMAWLEREKPNDVSQVRNYSQLTEQMLPRLFPELKATIAASRLKVPFVVQVGDLVEGLCGTPELARRQCTEAVRFVREANLGAPMLFTKGNHDVTGPGSGEAFSEVLLPMAGDGAHRELKSASYTIDQGDVLFAYYDSYSRDSLPWFEKTLEGRSAKHLIVVIHQPVVPFGARSTWGVFAGERQAAERARLLKLLGRHRAVVLCGHLHKFGTVVRKTDEGPFVQLMVSSILSTMGTQPRDHVEGVAQYGPDLVRLEPKFSPDTEAARREVLRAETPFIRQFEYADAPGYALLEVEGNHIRAQVYQGLSKQPWKTLDLTGMRDA